MSTALASLLEEGPLLADGGTGTSLIERGAPLGGCIEAYNAKDPALVSAVHAEFVAAGAELIETNTFGANRFRLHPRGFGERVADFNTRGAEVARRAGARVVAGSVGPLGIRLAPYGRVSAAEALDAFAEQIEALAGAGVDLIIAETQTDLAEAEQALAAARAVSNLPVIVTFTFTRDDRTLLGQTPEQVALRMAELGADGIGANCSQGPAQILRVVRAMRPFAGSAPLIAQPNAGSPEQVGGRYLYPATPEYFTESTGALLSEGVVVVGGCCGTGPTHTAAMAVALRGPRVPVQDAAAAPAGDEPATHEAAPTELGRKLNDGKFLVAVEMDPPRGFSAATMLAAAETMSQAGADVIDVADSPMARMRMSPWAACRLIQEEVGIETVLHFPTRGRNLLRLQGDLLAVHALGIRNVFVCMGDPVAIGDYPGATDNVDVAPTGLIGLIDQSFNRGEEQSGASIGEPTSFLVGCAVSISPPDLDKECRLLKKKIDSGAAFALSQPVYSIDSLELFRREYESRHGKLELPILAGVLPVVTARHAEFLHNEVPGIAVPDDLRERMRKAGDRAEQVGMSTAAGLAAELRDHAAGIYLMPPFGRFDLAAELVERVRAD
ncbi:MAG: bifunctional homocysteine S-methyltransferase/methylenetetrahydrofolate reductase [Actinomycetota bacterium]